MFNIKEMKEKLKESDFKSYFENIQKREDIENIQIERFHNKYSSDINNIIEKIVNKYDSDKYVFREYKIGYEPRTPLLFFLYDYAIKYGSIPDQEIINTYSNMFTSGDVYIIGNYFIQKMDGQGSVCLITKLK